MDDCARKICPLPTLGAGREGAAAVASAAAASVAAARSAILTGSNSLPARRQNDASAGAAPLHAVPYHPAASTKLVAQAAETAETEVSKGPANGSGVGAAAEGAHLEAPGARVAEGALQDPGPEPTRSPGSSSDLSGLSSVPQERVTSVTAVVSCDDATAAIQLLAHSRPASSHTTTQLHCQKHNIKAGEEKDTPAPEAHQRLLPPQVDGGTRKLQVPQQQQNKRALEESAVVVEVEAQHLVRPKHNGGQFKTKQSKVRKHTPGNLSRMRRHTSLAPLPTEGGSSSTAAARLRAASKVEARCVQEIPSDGPPGQVGDGGAGIKCLICLAEPAVGTEVCLLRCGHQHCRYCIEQWFALNANNTCPT